jgi:ribonuclease BN (tRNA processing enzyme)
VASRHVDPSGGTVCTLWSSIDFVRPAEPIRSPIIGSTGAGEEHTELRVLGACGSWPAPGDATSGYLVRDSGFALVMDLGTGTFAHLQEVVSPLDLGAVVISHSHPDHFVDLYALFYFLLFHPDARPPIPLYAPPGLLDAVTRYAPPDRAREIRRAFDLQEVAPGMRLEIGPFNIQIRQMHHQPATIGLRITAGSATLAYTADTGPTDQILSLARSADLLLCEATWLEAKSRPLLHLSARQAGEYGRAADADELLLTHLWPLFDPSDAAAEAASAFGRSVTSARTGLTVPIG